jgi:formamidopyrimidine-DNA glycosylase
MPELPEVETVVQSLRTSLRNRTVTGVDVRWERTIQAPDPKHFARRLQGQTITDVSRRGKWIVISLSGDGAFDTWLIHLRMTGQLILERQDAPDEPYARVLIDLDDGRRLRFSDMRKFGRMVLTDEPSEVLGELGPEPLDDTFTASRFAEMLAQRRGRIKSLLINQRFLVGLGNIYVNEALWQAGIHPERKANTVSSTDVQRLYQAIRSVLRTAIEENGTTLENGQYRQANGRAGNFAQELAVYDHDGDRCPRCGTTIERIEIGQRGTFVCPTCQPPPKET